jgi:hypothetical protein
MGRGLIQEKLGLIEKARADFQAALNAHSSHLDQMRDK